MTLSLADRSQKTSGIKILSQVGIDPDQDRKTLLKVTIALKLFCFLLNKSFAVERGRETAAVSKGETAKKTWRRSSKGTQWLECV